MTTLRAYIRTFLVEVEGEALGSTSKRVVEFWPIPTSLGRARTPTKHEMRQALSWARDRDSDTVAFVMGPWTLRACRHCGEPVKDGPNACELCVAIRALAEPIPSVFATSGSVINRPIDAGDLEARAQVAERASQSLAKLAIDLQTMARDYTVENIVVEESSTPPPERLADVPMSRLRVGGTYFVDGREVRVTDVDDLRGVRWDYV